MTSKFKNAIDIIENINYLNSEINLFKKEEKEIPEVLEIIETYKKDIEFYHDLLNSRLEFEVNLSKSGELIEALELFDEENKNFDYMVKAWNSDDECEAACNDPGLQYEQGELIEKMWIDLVSKYKK